MKSFQLIIIVLFLASALFGILVFAGVIPLGDEANTTGGLGTVVLWGTVPNSKIFNLIEEFNKENPSFVLKYEEKSADTFNQSLLEALASGTGPDLFFLPDDLTLSYANKIFTIPYGSFSVSDFNSTFAKPGEVFMTSRGLLAFPIAIDPLVMYYNQSHLDAKTIVYPPTSWNEFIDLVPKLTEKNNSNQILKSGAALGQFVNVVHAKDILALLFMQLDNKIVSERDGFFVSALESNSNLDYGLGFYTDFADPLKSIYSWNRSFPNSTDAFSAENLTFYFGFASELVTLVNRNPNQNFLVAPVPQLQDARFKLTKAKVTGVAISAFSKNFNTAFIAASLLATGDFAGKFADSLGVAPARRDLLSRRRTDAYSPIFYSSALISRSWLDPSPEDTDDVFREMIESVLSNRLDPREAIDDGSAQLNLLLQK